MVVDKFSDWFLESNTPLELSKGTIEELIPTLWLLGKTGAGKSSLVAEITGETEVTVGNGFMPCTKTTDQFLFPEDSPVVRFLDTRGLGEAGYEPENDVRDCLSAASALLVVVKMTEPDQQDVCETLRVNKSDLPEHVLVVYTHTEATALVERDQIQDMIQSSLEQSLGETVPSVCVDFATGYQLDELRARLAETLPEIRMLLHKEKCADEESMLFSSVRPVVLSHASIAACSDVFPFVGLASVPTITNRMLGVLASRYGVTWSAEIFKQFLDVLGIARTGGYFGNLLLRQAMKLIPGWGQTAGAAYAALATSSVTYAVGRAAGRYFYDLQLGNEVDRQAVREAYRSAFLGAQSTGGAK